MVNLALTLARYQDEFEEYREFEDLTRGEQAFFGVLFLAFALAFLVFAAIMIASYWRIFTKAGQPGWPAIVPFYNWIVLLRVIRRPVWMIVLFIVSGGIIGHVLAGVDLAKAFGKDTGYAVGLVLLPFAFYPMLAFGSATYDPARLEGRTY
ncbi:MAG: DUF5684 domain-containing protein [Actinomycetota bacterium]